MGEVFDAVASYLHDVGAIVIRPGIPPDFRQLVVVDTHWLTQNILGELICYTHNFQVIGGGFEFDTGETTSEGFEKLKEHLVDRTRKCGREIERDMIQPLLQGLELTYRIESDEGDLYFMPTLFGVGERSKLDWSPQTESGQLFGFRFKCADALRTCLSSVFFSRFEIHLRHLLMTKHGISSDRMSCSRGYMKITFDGYQIFLESDEQRGDHVDILVRFSQSKSRVLALNFVKKHIVENLTTFCASSKVCPGVRLVKAIIRTESVKRLVPMEDRVDGLHTVMASSLKQNFQEYAEQWLKDLSRDVDVEDEIQSLYNYEHRRPEVRKWDMTGESERASLLLEKDDVEDVITDVRMEHKKFRISLQQNLSSWNLVLARLREVSSTQTLGIATMRSQELKRNLEQQELGSATLQAQILN